MEINLGKYYYNTFDKIVKILLIKRNKNMKKTIIVSLILVLCIYSFMGIICLLLFGTSVQRDILKSIGLES